MRPAKTQISLGIRPVWSESLLSAGRKLGSSATYWAHCEGSDQTGRMPRLIWAFVGHTCHFVGFVMMRLVSHFPTPHHLCTGQTIVFAHKEICEFHVGQKFILPTLSYTGDLTSDLACTHGQDKKEKNNMPAVHVLYMVSHTWSLMTSTRNVGSQHIQASKGMLHLKSDFGNRNGMQANESIMHCYIMGAGTVSGHLECFPLAR